jgi:hypothetical protein
MANRLNIDAHAIAVALLLCGSTALLLFCSSGCGTTRSSDTNRTATEQLLISDAIDRAVQTINLQTLAGQSVFLDDSRLGDVVDRNYLVSTLRQHLLASGCALRAERDQADFIVEARAGAIGTDRNDLLFGVPSMNVPQILPVQPVPAAIPEVPIAKRRDQRGIAKIAVFAYHRESGLPVWQSGTAHQESSSNDVWILGAGPFQRGTIYEGTEFAGKTFGTDGGDGDEQLHGHKPTGLARERNFMTPQQIAARSQPAEGRDQSVVQAVHEEPVSAAVPIKPATNGVIDSEKAEPATASVTAAPPAEPAALPASVGKAENRQTRHLISQAQPANSASGILSASVYESQVSRRSGAVDPNTLLPRPVDPVALPQPMLSPPR